MKKKLAPVLVVLALVAVGVGGYLMGQRSNAPTVENPPAESSTPAEPTPEVKQDAAPGTTPTTPAVETTSPEPSVDMMAFEEFGYELRVISDELMLYKLPIESEEYENHSVYEGQIFNNVEISKNEEWYRIYSANNAVSYIKNDPNCVVINFEHSAGGFTTTVEKVYLKSEYHDTGVNAYDNYTTGVGQNILFKATWNNGTGYLCVGVGYGDASDYIQILDIATSQIGYVEADKFTWTLEESSTPKVEVEQPKQEVETPKVEVEQPKQEVETPKVEQPKQEDPKQEQNTSENQGNSSGLPDWLLNDPAHDNGTDVEDDPGLEGGHVGNGPGDGITWNN